MMDYDRNYKWRIDSPRGEDDFFFCPHLLLDIILQIRDADCTCTFEDKRKDI